MKFKSEVWRNLLQRTAEDNSAINEVLDGCYLVEELF